MDVRVISGAIAGQLDLVVWRDGWLQLKMLSTPFSFSFLEQFWNFTSFQSNFILSSASYLDSSLTLRSKAMSTTKLQKFIVYAPDKTEEGTHDRRLAVREEHIANAQALINAGSLGVFSVYVAHALWNRSTVLRPRCSHAHTRVRRIGSQWCKDGRICTHLRSQDHCRCRDDRQVGHILYLWCGELYLSVLAILE